MSAEIVPRNVDVEKMLNKTGDVHAVFIPTLITPLLDYIFDNKLYYLVIDGWDIVNDRTIIDKGKMSKYLNSQDLGLLSSNLAYLVVCNYSQESIDSVISAIVANTTLEG